MLDDRVTSIATCVETLYKKPNPVIDWNEWVFYRHNRVVDAWVQRLAKQYECNVEQVRLAAYLHDIAYAWTGKNDPTLDEQSYAKARELLTELHMPQKEIDFIVNDIIGKHGAHSSLREESIETRVFAAADALAHLTTDFYLVMCWERYLFENKPLEEYKAWVLKKIERDYTQKVTLPMAQEIARPHYEALRRVFGAPQTIAVE